MTKTPIMNFDFQKKAGILFFLLSALFFAGWISQERIRIFLIGDSTVADKPLIDNPEHGWGQMLPIFFSDEVQIINYARNGRSTKSFINEGRWQTVVNRLRPGDYVFIQFGHNDAKLQDTSRYAAPHTTYRENLLKFVRQAREKHALPVLLTPVNRRRFDDRGKFVDTHGDYPTVVREVAKEEHVPLIDLHKSSEELLEGLGPEKSKDLFLVSVRPGVYRSLWKGQGDNTHFTRSGAVRIAGLVVEGIQEARLPLQKYLVESAAADLVGSGKVVGLDYFYNNEWRTDADSVKRRWHYVWEDTTNGGFSGIAEIIDRLGADLDTLQSAPTPESLKRFSVYIIVDPDTPLETPHPNTISQDAVDAIVPWVKAGGVLVLMNNDKGNAEFEHMNRLAGKFGIHFNEDSYHRVTGKDYDTGKSDSLPAHPMFKNVKQIFMKEICSLSIEKPAEAVLVEHGRVFMAECRFGKGLVFAVGDPWLYNEYLDNRKLPQGYENKEAAVGFFRWLLSNAETVR
jgi:lysophospholipase L1-like esterase